MLMVLGYMGTILRLKMALGRKNLKMMENLDVTGQQKDKRHDVRFLK
jgi:hypothetical protein